MARPGPVLPHGMPQKKLCIVHANCQGEPLAAFLRRVPGFGPEHEVRLYTNYIREPLPEEALSRCAVFLYQPLLDETHWGELTSGRVLARLPSDARTLAIPSMFFRAYWPFWVGGQEFQFSHQVLERLWKAGLPRAEALRVFLRGRVLPGAEVERRTRASLERERAKEAHTPIKYVDWILERFRTRMLFNQINHPGHELLCLVAREVLRHLEVEIPEQGVEPYVPELHPEFRMPVHPCVAAHWGLEFADETTRYPVYGRELTFAEYAGEYLTARQLGIDDFITYLRARATAADR